MKLGLIGHHHRIGIAEKAISQADPWVRIVSHEISGVRSLEHVELFRELQRKSEIIIIGGERDYGFFSKHTSFEKPTDFFPRGVATLTMAFLSAKFKGYDITNISIDEFHKDMIFKLFEELDYPQDKLRVFSYNSAYDYSLESNKKLFAFHFNNYHKHNVSICFTSISIVYEMLIEKSVPAFLLVPPVEVMLSVYERLKMTYLIKANALSDIVIIDINVSIPSKALINNDFQIAYEKIKSAEKIYFYAQKLQGFVDEFNLDKYLIVASKFAFERELEKAKGFSLIEDIELATKCTVRIGIGYGHSVLEARNNARSANFKTDAERSNAIIVYDNLCIKGPIFRTQTIEKNSAIDNKIIQTSEVTGIGISTLSKILHAVERYKKSAFTINELSEISGTPIRTMYRVVEKLEMAGLVEITGKSVNENLGRPRSIINIKI